MAGICFHRSPRTCAADGITLSSAQRFPTRPPPLQRLHTTDKGILRRKSFASRPLRILLTDIPGDEFKKLATKTSGQNFRIEINKKSVTLTYVKTFMVSRRRFAYVRRFSRTSQHFASTRATTRTKFNVEPHGADRHSEHKAIYSRI